MEKSVLVDLKKNRIHAVAENVQAAAQLAALDKLSHCYMCAPTAEAFGKFPVDTLRAIAHDLTGVAPRAHATTENLIIEILSALPDQDGRSLEALVKASGGVPVDLDDPRPMEKDTSPAPRKELGRMRAGRPKTGSATGRVWAIADSILAVGTHSLADKGLRLAVVDRAVAEGINPSTAGVQFLKWKKTQEGA